MNGTVVIVGGTSGIGLQLASAYAERGAPVVVTGRDEARARAAAGSVGEGATGLGFDLAAVESIGAALAGVDDVARLVLAATERDANPIRAYDPVAAARLTTLKLVGYAAAVHALVPRLRPDASLLLFGGIAGERPYPGSTTVTTVAGGVTALVRSLVVELAPIRVNALHPGLVEDSPAWAANPAALDPVRAKTPTGRLVTMADAVEAALFLLEHPSVNGVDLVVDGGFLCQPLREPA